MHFDLTATLVFVFVTTFTPGPNNILSASMGALYGYRRTLPFLAGVVCGFVIIMTLSATLSSALKSFLPSAAPVMRYLGAAYILWLAFGVYRNSGALLDRHVDARPLPFLTGLTLQFVNPKGVFFGLTIYSTFLAPFSSDFRLLLVAPLALAPVTFAGISTWALGGQAIRGWIDSPAKARIVGIILALSLAYTALDVLGVI